MFKQLLSLLFSKAPRFHLVENSIPPRSSYKDDAGLDIAIQEDAIIQPGETLYLRAGIKLELPRYVCAKVMTRSGTFKHGVTVVPTLIDRNYPHEISTIVSNYSDKPIEIKKGTFLAQVVVGPYFTFGNINETNSFESRNENDKFGSSERNGV